MITTDMILSLVLSVAFGGTVALIIGNTCHAAIERWLAKRRQQRAAKDAGVRIAARAAAGDV